MKKSILVLAIMLATANAYATPLVDNSTNLSAGASALAGASSSSSAVGVGLGGAGGNANAVGVGGAGFGGVGVGGAGGSVGNTTQSFGVEAADYGDLRVVPPAIAPSVNTAIICPMVMQGSKAGSVFFFSGSGTHKPDIVAICVAYHLKQLDVVERMACDADKAYAKANPNCEVK